MIQKYKSKATKATWVCIGLIMALVAFAFFSEDTDSKFSIVGRACITTAFMISYFIAAWYYIKAKGRSQWWMFALALNIFGLIVIVLLRDRAPELRPPGLA